MKPFIFQPSDSASIIGHGPGSLLVCRPGHLALLADDRAALVRKSHGDNSLVPMPSKTIAIVAAKFGCGITRDGPDGDVARCRFLFKQQQDRVAAELLKVEAERPRTADELDTLTVPKLRVYAAEREIELPADAKKKAEIIKAIVDAEAA